MLHITPDNLRARFLMVTGTLLIVSSFSLAMIHYYESKSLLLGELEKRGFALSQSLAARSKPVLESPRQTPSPVALAELREQVAALGAEPDVRMIIVQDAQGRVLAEHTFEGRTYADVRADLVNTAWRPRESVLTRSVGNDNHALYAFSTPIVAGTDDREEYLGTVRVGLCTEATLSRIGQVFRLSLGFGFAVALLGLVGIVILTRWTLKPIREMATVARAVAFGDLTRKVAVGSRDEIGALGEAFNDMTESLATSREALARRAEELEASALEKEQLYREARDRARRLRVLHELSQALSSSLEPAEIHAQVHRQLSRLMPYELLVVLRHDPEGATYRPDFFWTDRKEAGPLTPELIAEDLFMFDRVRETAMPVSIPSFEDDETLADGWMAGQGLSSGFLVPVMAQGEFMGVLGLASRRRNAFSRSEIAVVNAIAGNLGLVLKNAELYQRLQHSFGELKETQDKLADSESARHTEKLRSMGEMASGVAHDFNNVLAAITGRVQLLKMALERRDPSPDEIRRSLDIIERSARDGAETVRRVQEFSRGQDRQATMQRTRLDRLVEEAVEITRPRWQADPEGRGVRVTVETDLTPGVDITCVPSEIREALTNLVFNAVDAMPEGGVITLRTEAVAGGTLLTVSDTGTGISPEDRERVFEPFFTTKGVDGNGLGLSIVYGILQRHGGGISVHQAPGGGTEFRLRFPPAEAAGEEGAEEPVLSARPCRILIGDDEANVRETLADLLAALGHDVEQATDGEQIMARFRPGRFDVVLTDLGMPDISGWEVARRIRQVDADVPIVLVTGWGNQIRPEDARARGVTRVLAKPFTLEKVASVIAEILGLEEAA